MIYGLFHRGSGLGNQLHRYIATRVLALDKGYDFSMTNPEGFKGKSFMQLDMGKKNNFPFHIEEPAGKVVMDMPGPEIHLPLWEEWNKNVYDPDINFVKDHTIIDGNFEDPKYFEHRLYEIDKWLETEKLNIPDDVCVIGFRGGEYYTVPELGLPKEYYDRAIEEMRKINPKMKFEVHTDDLELAKDFFPYFKVFRDVEINWRSVRHAKYAIIANSSFYVLPRLLNGGLTIAPRYFNRYNTKKWDYPQSYYKSFKYI
jgi:hypothetical protein